MKNSISQHIDFTIKIVSTEMVSSEIVNTDHNKSCSNLHHAPLQKKVSIRISPNKFILLIAIGLITFFVTAYTFGNSSNTTFVVHSTEGVVVHSGEGDFVYNQVKKSNEEGKDAVVEKTISEVIPKEVETVAEQVKNEKEEEKEEEEQIEEWNEEEEEEEEEESNNDFSFWTDKTDIDYKIEAIMTAVVKLMKTYEPIEDFSAEQINSFIDLYTEKTGTDLPYNVPFIDPKVFDHLQKLALYRRIKMGHMSKDMKKVSRQEEGRLMCQNAPPFTTFTQALSTPQLTQERRERKEVLCEYECDPLVSSSTCQGDIVYEEFVSSPMEFVTKRDDQLPFCTSKNDYHFSDGTWIVPCEREACGSQITDKSSEKRCFWERARWAPKNCKINNNVMDESKMFHLEDKLTFTSKYRESNQLATHPNFLSPSQNISIDSVSAVVHMSTDKMEILLQLLSYWDGPVSLSVYIKDEQKDKETVQKFWNAHLEVQSRVAIHLVIARNYELKFEGQAYPFNIMRNMAMEGSLTQYGFTLDVDFMPSEGVFDHFLDLLKVPKHREHLHNKGMIVAPAFETDDFNSTTLPRTKKGLLKALEEKTITQFHSYYDIAHRASNYKKWVGATETYDVVYEKEYEPYVLIHIPSAPRFAEEFKSRFYDKQSWFKLLQAEKFNFAVSPSAFVVHINHSYGTNPILFRSFARVCLRKRFRSFLDFYYWKK
eukprot:Awhi_evm1s9884